MSKHKIVIVGGGFGGLKAALTLAKDHRFDITIINDHPDFRVYPALYRVSTGGPRSLASIPLTEVFRGKHVRIVHDKVTALDRQSRTVGTESGQTFAYDGLILGLGVVTNFFGISGLPEYSYGIKTLADAERLKMHLHAQIAADKKQDLNYVVIGGGPTGVELAGALPAYVRAITKQHGLPRRAVHVDLIEAAPRVLPRAPKSVSRRVQRQLRKLGVKLYLKTAVQAQTADTLIANDKPIRSHTVIWTAGVANHPFFKDQGFQIARNNKVRVDQFLQTEPGIYVIGDNADTPYSGVAQTALYDGQYVAKNLIRIANDKDARPYQARKPIYVFPAGPHFAATVWGPIKLYGMPSWILRRLADWVVYKDYLPFVRASKRWMQEDQEENHCPTCNPEQGKSTMLAYAEHE